MKCTKHIKVIIIIIIHDYCSFNITVRKQVQIRAAVCFGHKYMAKICAFSETSTWTTICESSSVQPVSFCGLTGVRKTQTKRVHRFCL